GLLKTRRERVNRYLRCLDGRFCDPIMLACALIRICALCLPCAVIANRWLPCHQITAIPRVGYRSAPPFHLLFVLLYPLCNSFPPRIASSATEMREKAIVMAYPARW